MTTMELSTNMPTPTARPASEITLRVTPEKYMSTTAKVSEIGMEQATTSVGLTFRRKISRIRMASSAPTRILSSTEEMTMSI